MRIRLNDGARALMVMTAAILTDLPGVVMLFSPRAICVMPGENAARFGLTPLEDQQIAGLLMWVPANLVFFGIAMFLFARWIGTDAPRRLILTAFAARQRMAQAMSIAGADCSGAVAPGVADIGGDIGDLAVIQNRKSPAWDGWAAHRRVPAPRRHPG